MEYEDLVASLLRTTARLFYDPPHCVVLDLLLNKLILHDTELTHSLKMLSKEFHKIIVKLKEDKLIKVENKIDNIDGRQNVKTIYYLDFCQIKDTIKYKVYKMTKLFETQRKELYICKTCSKEFSLLDIQSLVVEYKFICDECCGELTEKVENKGNVDLHKLMMTEIQVLINLLKQLDAYDIKSMDYFQVLKIREEREKSDEVIHKSDEHNTVEDNLVENCDAGKIENEYKDIEDEKNDTNKNEQKIAEFVKVEGKNVLFCDITPEDVDKMSGDEYTAYWNVYESNQNK